MGDVMNMWCMLPLGLFTFLWPLIAPALVRGPKLRSPVIFYICGILVTAVVDKVMFFLWTMIVVLAVQLYCHDPQRAVTLSVEITVPTDIRWMPVLLVPIGLAIYVSLQWVKRLRKAMATAAA
jgi:hypothetical protein